MSRGGVGQTVSMFCNTVTSNDFYFLRKVLSMPGRFIRPGVVKAYQRLAAVLAWTIAGLLWILTMRTSVAGSGFGSFGSGGVFQTNGFTGLMAGTGLALYGTVVLTYMDGFLLPLGCSLSYGKKD